MLPFRDTSDSIESATPVVRGRRRIAVVIQRRGLEEPLSWLIWLFAVGLFALWIYAHYGGSSGTSWIGLTIHTLVFAIWGLVARAWLLNRLRRRQGP